MRGDDMAVEGCKSYERLEVKLLPCRRTEWCLCLKSSQSLFAVCFLLKR